MNFIHKLIKFLVVSIMLLFCSIAFPQEVGQFKPTVVDSSPPEYRWLSFMSSGPADTSMSDASPDGIRGMFYRLTFIENDDAFSRPTMRIDEIVYADAGCCWTIHKSWDVDLNKLEKSGVRMPNPECSSIDSVIWIDINAVEINYGESVCTISDIGEKKILAKCDLKESNPGRCPRQKIYPRELLHNN